MSILLEALKKSEATRRLGETPTLQTPMTAEESSPGGQSYWIPALMLAITVVLITYLGLVQFRPLTAPPESVTLQTGISQSGAIPPVEDPAGEIHPEIKPEAVVPTEPRAKQEKTAGTPVKDFSVAARAPDSSKQSTRRPVPHRRNSAETKATASAATDQEPLNQDTPSSNSTSGLPQAENPAAVAQENGDHVAPYETEPISYWQIPQSVREGMPQLHISVLVYAENPQDRFLLVGGERLKEKQELSDGLVLEEIQRDRAIFTYRNYRFQVKG